MQLSLISGREKDSTCKQYELHSLQKALPFTKKGTTPPKNILALY